MEKSVVHSPQISNMAEEDTLLEASNIKNGNLSNYCIHFWIFFFFLSSPVVKSGKKLLFSYTVLHPFESSRCNQSKLIQTEFLGLTFKIAK